MRPDARTAGARPIRTEAELSAVLGRALDFAARNDYANVAVADGLGSFLLGVLARAADIPAVRARDGDLRAGLDAWAGTPAAARAEVVRRWRALLPPPPAGSRPAPPTQQPTPDGPGRPPAAPAPASAGTTRRAGGGEAGLGASALDAVAGRRERVPLDTPVVALRGVGPKTADRLAERGLRTVRDLLHFLPRRYVVRPPVRPIGEVVPGGDDPVAVAGWVRTVRGGWGRARGRGGRPAVRIDVEDASGRVGVRFFGLALGYLAARFPVGARVLVCGRVEEREGRLEFVHPDALPIGAEDVADAAADRVTPVYLDIDGVPQGAVRRIVREALSEFVASVPDGVPADVAARHDLVPLSRALAEVHRPPDDADGGQLERRRTPGWRRLVFEELFVFQTGIALRRRSARGARAPSFAAPDGTGPAGLVDRFVAALPFRLTGAQRRVLDEVLSDLADDAPMNRLVQGDVGCGKTVIAMAAACAVVAGGAQAAVMAPTELLAEQHLATFRRWLAPIGVEVEGLTGGMRRRAREAVLRRMLAGTAGVVVGTHALIQDDVELRRLGLAVVDEQHRFGVRQRLALRGKGRGGEVPHVLVMSATPIPRSLSLTLYGDLDVSLVDERPPGRGVVRTEVIPQSRRADAHERVRDALTRGHQAYLICPAVEAATGDASGVPPDPAGDDGGLRAATETAAALAAGPLRGFEVGLLHGRLKADEKDAVMGAFASGRTRALVATTVVEVGVDVPGATVMVVEQAERFGLAQLHQLRGRIGRGDRALSGADEAVCLLVAADAPGTNAADRLDTLVRTDDGFAIAEADLLQRGPGEFLGTRQAGLPRFNVADLLRDGDILREAREAAFSVVEADPSLEHHPGLRAALHERWAGRIDLLDVG